MKLDEHEIQAFAREALGLPLDASEAEKLVGPLRNLGAALRRMDEVPLPFLADDFIEPGLGARWLEEWDSEEAGR